MIDATLKIDISAALAVLNRLTDSALPVRIATAVADEVVIPNLAKYPAPVRKKYPFVSAKQRAFVMAAIRRGTMQVPYQRTGRLGASFAKQPMTGGLTLRSGVGYSDVVLEAGKQAAYHRGVWETTEAIAQRSESDAALAATAVLVQVIGDAGP